MFIAMNGESHLLEIVYFVDMEKNIHWCPRSYGGVIDLNPEVLYDRWWVITVPAGGLALVSAGPSAGIEMTKFGFCQNMGLAP